MALIVTRSYDSYAAGSAVVDRLEQAGLASSKISIVASRPESEDSYAGEGAGIGAGLGGVAGLLAGLGLLAIPGIGPVVAAGWLASAAAGAAVGGVAGGLVGALTEAGVSDEVANQYADTVRRGGSIVSVQAEEEEVPAVEAIMDGAMPLDPARRVEEDRDVLTPIDDGVLPRPVAPMVPPRY